MRFDDWFVIDSFRLSSVFNVSLWRPLRLIHESAFRSCTFVVDDVVPSDALPPTRIDRTFEDPSAKSEVMRTLALGTDKKGELSVAFRDTPNDVVDRITDLTYDTCRAWIEPAQLFDSPACAGESQLLNPVGRVRPQLPFTVSVTECPRDEFGVKSNEPRSDPRWTLLSLGNPDTLYGSSTSVSASRSRATESWEIPTACSPMASMSSKVRRSRVLSSNWNVKL